MAAGIEIYNYVTNQKGSPALYSDVLANRPAAGFIGRLFISTDTLEIYRDNGTTWDLISGGGGGGVNIYNSDGSLTGARTMTMANHNLTFEGGANPARLIISANNNIAKIFQFRTANVARWDFRVDDNETGGDTGSNWHLRAHNDAGAFTFNPISVTRSNGEKSFYAQENLTAGTEALAGVFNISAGTYGAGLTFIGGNAHAAQFNNFTIANGGSFTFASSSFVGASGNVLRVQANASGTVTMTPSTPGIRTAAVMLNQIQYNTSGGRNLVYTHAANIQTLGILQLIADGSFTVTNAYGVIINDLNEYGFPSSGAGALILTNRWGIYQDSTVDVNYFGGTTLIGTTTNAGYKLDVAGTLRNTTGAYFATTSGNVGVGTASPDTKLDVRGEISVAYNSTYGLRFYNDARSNWSSIGNDVTGSAQAVLVFKTGFGEVARMTHAGKLLLNTSTDAGAYALQVAGSIYNTTGAVLAATSGNVGVGTVTPQNDPGYKSVTINGTSGGQIGFYAGGVQQTNMYGDATGLTFVTTAATPITFLTNSLTRMYINSGGIGVGTGSFSASQTNGINVRSGTAPTTNVADVFVLYAADITAGNAAPHFRTENGNVIKIYQETTGVAASAFTANTGTAVNDASTFDGYTLQQVVKALKNLGILA